MNRILTGAVDLPQLVLSLPLAVRQLVRVSAAEKAPLAQLQRYVRQDGLGLWKADGDALLVNIGKNGVTATKREGDQATPAGLFRLGLVFGSLDCPAACRMPYRQTTLEDKWIDDVNDRAYNSWVSGETSAQSFEVLLREDGLYELGIVIEYNTDPVCHGAGSAIFIHRWRGLRVGSEGCVALSPDDLRMLVAWLDPLYEPHILIEE